MPVNFTDAYGITRTGYILEWFKIAGNVRVLVESEGVAEWLSLRDLSPEQQGVAI